MYWISGPGARGAVSWGIALEAVRFQVPFPMEFFIDIILLTVALGLTKPLTENEYQKYFLGRKGGWCVGLTVLSLSCADCLGFWEHQPPGILWACNRPAQGFYLTFRGQDESPSSGLHLSKQWSLYGNYVHRN